MALEDERKSRLGNFKFELLMGQPGGLSQGFGCAGLEPQGDVAAIGIHLGNTGSVTIYIKAVRLDERLGGVVDGGKCQGLSPGTLRIQGPGGDGDGAGREEPSTGLLRTVRNLGGCACVSLSHSYNPHPIRQ